MFSTENIKKMVKENHLDKFYNDRSWRNLAKSIRQEQHNECQYCKRKGKVSKAEFVHHVKEIKKHPELAYSKYYVDERGVRQLQLMACCYWCHEIQHGRANANRQHTPKGFQNLERW